MLRVRNHSYAPYLEREGRLICPMPKPNNIESNKTWHANLKAHERLYYHQTLASVRGCKRFMATTKIPKDSLDFQLQSRYVHSRDYFPEKVDFVLQVETCQRFPQTFRVLRNTRDIPLEQPELIGHPLKIGGLKEKLSPHSVKLINSGPHTQLVNNGYSRQPADGNFFRY
ncbi:hypothetical protein FF38_07087 [Lucilia cuprina]|uniref:Uncharacterized protein n=1 Tax=Lucilia cuprina TaxID=7375 RepID=A0A0L0C5I6_LUCCU|nr:protein C1orf194 homolog [Lucilia cuprina]KAI8118674.1 hypothetical protein CVS40_9727 [Lucilia cuprina]KNC27658.1 hypothetical protein FF38_07087 [Lucilia cuprina]